MRRKAGPCFEERQPSRPPDGAAAAALTVQFLAWVADRPRTRTDVMDAWRSSCPRLTVWEDAVIDGLVELDASGSVTLTQRGRTLLESSPLAGSS
jgi:hypothetical protein